MADRTGLHVGHNDRLLLSIGCHSAGSNVAGGPVRGDDHRQGRSARWDVLSPRRTSSAQVEAAQIQEAPGTGLVVAVVEPAADVALGGEQTTLAGQFQRRLLAPSS